MSVQIPELIMTLINSGLGTTLVGWNYALYDAVQSVDLLKKQFGEDGLTQDQLSPWYEASIKDNFLNIYDDFGKDRTDLLDTESYTVTRTDESGARVTETFIRDKYPLVKSYKSLVEKEFGGAFYGEVSEFNSIFLNPNNSQNEKALTTNLNNSIRLNFTPSLSEAGTIFRDRIVYDSNDAVERGLKGATYLDVLKAYSLYLSLKNYSVVEEKIKTTTTTSGEKLEDDNLRRQIFRYLNDLEKRGTLAQRELGNFINDVADAQSAINASKFDKQRYLIENIETIQELSKERFKHQLSTADINFLDGEFGQLLGIEQTRILKFTNSSKNAVNRIVGASRATEMFRLPTVQLSKLVPEIKLFKVIYDKNLQKEKEVEIRFPTKFVGAERIDVDGQLSDNSNYKKPSLKDPYDFLGTKTGYGIKSFSWEYKGSDPFSVDRDIEATLELYFQDFSEFTRDRPEGYRYVDLLLPADEEKAPLDKVFNQGVRVKAGWAVPQSLEIESDGDAIDLDAYETNQKKINAIKASQVNLVLDMVDYNISFENNGNGASTIAINYRARTEALGKNRLVNVIGATREEAATTQYLEDKISTSKDPEEKEELRKRQQDLFERIRSLSSKRFIEKLMDNRSIYWRKLNLPETMASALGEKKGKEYFLIVRPEQTWKKKYIDGLKLSLDQLNPVGAGGVGPVAPVNVQDLELFTMVNDDSQIVNPTKIMYTFLGDILQVALENAVESGSYLGAPKSALEDLKLALLDFRVGEETYNLADLPIEMNVFLEFLHNSIGKRNEHTKSFINFTNELLSEILINRVDSYLNLKDATSRSFKIGYAEMNKELLGNFAKSYDLDRRSDVDTINKLDKQDNLFVYSDSPDPSSYKITNYEDSKENDEKNGLHHFSLGSTKGIVKNISFDRIDIEYIREQRLTVNPEDPYALLSNVFNVNVSMFGNNFFRPGSYIYVDPKIMGNLGNPWQVGTIANRMGLGGYHIVTGVTNKINLNAFETSIDAVFETSGDGVFSLTSEKEDGGN